MLSDRSVPPARANKVWHWQAMSKDGSLASGRIAAPSRQQAIQRLAQQYEWMTRIKRSYRQRHVRNNASCWALRLTTLSQLLAAGIGLAEALHQQAQAAVNDQEFLFWDDLSERVSSGMPLSAALEHTGIAKVLVLAVPLISLAEQSGGLTHTLANLALQLEKRLALQQRLIAPMRYPALIAAVSIVMMIAMMSYIVPVFRDLYGKEGEALPLATSMLFSLSTLLCDHTLVLLVSLCAALVPCALAWRTRGQWLHRLPFIGSMVRSAARIELLDSLALGQRSNIGLDITLSRLGDNYHGITVGEILKQLTRGFSIAESIRQSAGFSAHTLSIIANGTRCGRLAAAFEHAALLEQRQLERRLGRVELLIEPLMMLALTLGLGAIVVALYLPVFDLGQRL
ncbi:putative type II secretion system protein F [Carnimonas sp. R-84981]|uniref:type II secretion system F family protein n=1 Tax=Carnimonas bestiolae TaxID=3402172 RepID=UPI003EDB7A31